MKPAAYWRQNKEWKNWIGKTGTVVVATMVRVAPPDQELFVPYAFALVDFGTTKKEFMGAGNQELQTGDKVRCVLRKISGCFSGGSHNGSDDGSGYRGSRGIIDYGIKVEKIK